MRGTRWVVHYDGLTSGVGLLDTAPAAFFMHMQLIDPLLDSES